MKIKFLILAGCIFGLLFSVSVSAQTSNSYNISDEMDAIAVRVLPNPNHYNAVRWYKSQGFQGSPQSLMVDGYDAVRDGRTVYVNASNVDLTNQTIYTNIYLISYNQSPDFKTVDVLGQIVKNWRFNSNLTVAGQCNISTLLCQQDTDCSDSYTCVGAGEGPGRCQPTENTECYIDSDCADGIYCSSLRAKVNRDVRRLGILGDMRESLSAFKQTNNRYPVLDAGTYVPLHSVSTWPSWQSLFLSQIGSAQTSVDPINVLGSCAGFDATTCWNQATNSFADPNPNNSTLELPVDSYAFVYSSDENGSNYVLCAGMETKALGYNTSEGQLAESGCVSSGSAYTGSGENIAPSLISSSLQGNQDQVFNGSIRVIDPENNYLTWSISTAGNNWSSWSAAPIIQDTANPNQKRIYAQKAGAPGVYNITLNVSDGYGGSLSTVTPITIVNNAPVITGQDINYYPSTVLPLIVNFSITDADQPLNHTFTHATWSSGPYDLLSSSRSTFLGETSNRVGDTVNYTRKYNILTSNKFSIDTNFVYVVHAQDAYGNASDKQINITVKADPPALDFNCNSSVRTGSEYYCGLGWAKQGDHTITYSAVGPLPAGLSISEATNIYEPGSNDCNVSKNTIWQKIKRLFAQLGTNQAARAADTGECVIKSYYAITGTPTVAAQDVIIKIEAENEFGAFSEKEFTLDVNTYCGDGNLNQPNSEAKGGLYNDGYEDCDGISGTVSNAQFSSLNNQYCCRTQSNTVYPITTNDTCIFAAVTMGGGFCGDGYCTTNFENTNNCPGDCGTNYGNTPGLSLTCGVADQGTVDDTDGAVGDTDNDDEEEDDNGDTTDGSIGDNDKIDCSVFTYDGEVYVPVLLGDQCWLSENLNRGTFVNGDAPDNEKIGLYKYCYNNNPSNCDLYGGLYPRNVAVIGSSVTDIQGICPDGWHIPRDTEWHELESTISGNFTTTCDPNRTSFGCYPAGTALKSGLFNGQLVGYYNYQGDYFVPGVVYYWGAESTVISGRQMGYYSRGLNNFGGVSRATQAEGTNGLSVRCIKD